MFNISYFIETAPGDFENFTLSDKWRYFQDNLNTFDQLGNQTQWAIAEYLSISDIKSGFDDFLTRIDSTVSDLTATYLAELASWMESQIATEIPPTTAEPVCGEFEENRAFFVLIMCPVAVVVLLVLSFVERRKYLNLGCCYGKPGVVIPIDLVTPTKRRWAQAAVFATMAYAILYLFEGDYYYIPEEFKNPEWTKTYGWSRVFVMMLNVIMVCMTSYPLLACLTLRKSIIANVLGIIYVSPWIVGQILLWAECPITIRNSDDELNYNTLLSYIFDLPIFVCYGLIVIAYVLDMIKNCRKRCCNYQKKKLELTEPYKYVVQLLANSDERETASKIRQLKSKFLYSKILGFKYSPRIICAMIVCFFTLFKLSVEIDFLMWYLTGVVDYYIGEFAPTITEVATEFNINATQLLSEANEAMGITVIELKVAIYLSFLLHVYFMIDTTIKYRHHVRKMFRGDYTWHFKNQSSPASHLVASMRYGGYQVAYMLYGWFIFAALLFLVLMLLTFLLFIPLRNGKRNFVINAIINLWPTIIVSLVIYFAQLLVCKFCFLQQNGRYLAFTNRRIYHIVDFFLFFYNVVLGFFSCLKRVLFSLVFGTLLISRLDKVLLMKGFERFDSGYKSYLGVLQVDIYHSHPVLKVFIQLLEKAREERQGNMLTPKLQHQRKYRNKWYRAYTLARNPSIVLEKMAKDLKEKQKSTEIEDEVIENAGAFFTGMMGLGVANGIANAASVNIDMDENTSL